MSRQNTINRRFLELVGNVCQYEEFGEGRMDMRNQINDLLLSGGTATMHRDIPWLTDVFFHGIIGEMLDETSPASKGLRGELERTLDETMSCAREARLLELVRLADEQFRRLPTTEQQGMLPVVLGTFGKLLAYQSAKGRVGALLAAWIGKHGPLPFSPYRAWDETELSRVALKNDGDVVRGLDATRRRNREQGLEILHNLAATIAYGLDRRGIGNVPAFHVEGRLTSDGDIVAAGDDGCVNVNMVLDTLAMNAFLWFMDVRDRNGKRVPSYGPMRVYLDGPASSRYLIGMVQDAVANQRGRVFGRANTPRVRKESLDEPAKVGDKTATRKKVEELSAEEMEAGGDNDRARFCRNVIGTLSPRLYKYLTLVHEGMPKMAALKAVGAKSAHFVEREAKMLMAELAKLKGEDYAELAKLVAGLMKGARR